MSAMIGSRPQNVFATVASRSGPRHCYCREGITHWLEEADRCPSCGGSLTDGPWAGEELAFGIVHGFDVGASDELEHGSESDAGIAGFEDEWTIVLTDELEAAAS